MLGDVVCVAEKYPEFHRRGKRLIDLDRRDCGVPVVGKARNGIVVDNPGLISLGEERLQVQSRRVQHALGNHLIREGIADNHAPGRVCVVVGSNMVPVA